MLRTYNSSKTTIISLEIWLKWASTFFNIQKVRVTSIEELNLEMSFKSIEFSTECATQAKIE
jgi:hypothetical protein